MALSALSRQCKHHVFPSFHGADVRRNVLSCLLKEFKEKLIDVFIDNDIDRSKSIGPELIEAIRGSIISVVLISRKYASSTWCLNELVEIMKCRDEDMQTTMVIFYEVEPSEVKKQTGYFGAVFEETCAGKTTEEVERWRQALQEVAKIAGYHSPKFDSDAVMIETIATDISNKLNDSTTSNDNDNLVGMDNHIMKMNSLLALATGEEVRMVGIWGPAGIGKTTIARALYRKLSSKFTHTAFIESIKGKFEQNSLDEHGVMLQLQAHLLSKTLNQKDLKIDHLGVAKARLKDKKVLVILDDVDDLKQLEAMANKACWFGPGSRIIITTKDNRILKAHAIHHIYPVPFPSTSEALEILCISAFRQKSPSSGLEDIALEVTQLAGNLPLGLTVFGAYLLGIPRDQWINALPRLRTSLDGDIVKVLRVSYDALCDKDQQLFLHIACLFNGERVDDLMEYLEESGLDVSHGLEVLVAKSLISIDEERCVLMHNLLEQLGKEIVRKSTREPGKRQFLVDSQEICDVLEYSQGTGTIRGIDFELSFITREWSIGEAAFENMYSLQFLKVRGLCNNSSIPQDLKFVGSKLRLLQWYWYPLTSFPCAFRPRCLVKLDMQDSSLEKLWEGTMPLPCLKWMYLTGSTNLKKIPDLSNATNLKELEAGFCSSLVELHSSVGKATSLQKLNLNGCLSLEQLPFSIGNVMNLKELNLNGCEALVELPSSIRSLERLEMLFIANCLKLKYWGSRLKNFPDLSTNMRELDLSGTVIEEVPALVMLWTRLRTLSMLNCKSLKVFPDVPDSIEELELSATGIEKVPTSIQNLSRLTKLRMVGCEKLKVLPTNINLKSLSSLDFSFCTQLKMFPEISTSFEYLSLRDTAIEEVPSSVWSWFRLLELNLEDCKSLQVFHIALDSIKELELSNRETNFMATGLDTIRDNYRPLPLRINLSGCKNLVSLPHLPNFVSILDAAGCESLERIYGLSTNPETCINFANCLKLSQKAKELVEVSDCKFVLLPGGKLPADFDHQAKGDFLTVNLDQRPFQLFLRFKACLLLLGGKYFSVKYSQDHKVDPSKMLSCCVSCIQNGLVVGYGSCEYQLPALLGLTEHLYFFESSISINLSKRDVNFSELEFKFKITGEYWEIKECGVRLLEDPGVHDDHGSCGNNCSGTEYKESADIKITENLHEQTIRTSNSFRVPEVAHKTGDNTRDSTREWGACVHVTFLCIGILVYYRLEHLLVFLLPLFIYGTRVYQ